MNWAALIAAIVQIVQLLLKPKAGQMAAAGPAECDHLAAQLESAVAPSPKGAAAGVDGGILDDVNAIIAALKAHDLKAVAAALSAFFSHL